MEIVESLAQKYPNLAACISDAAQAAEILETCFRQGGKLLVCGNGGSAADSEHIVGELMKGYLHPRSLPVGELARFESVFPSEGAYLWQHLQGALPAISLVSQVSLTTAFANDVAADMVFAQQVYGYGRPGDALIGLSTSGNSANVLHALRVGRMVGLKTIGFSGRSGGQMPGLCDALIRIPADRTADIQEGHMAVYHALCALLEERFFGR